MIVRAPYGSWASHIDASDLAAAGVRLSEARLDGGDVYWLERRPDEQGRNALVCRRASGHTADVLTQRWSVRSTVHEYGGGSYAVRDGLIVFVQADDQCLYTHRRGGHPTELTESVRPTRSVRFADLAISPDLRYVVAVREQHRADGVVNDLVAIALDGEHRGTMAVLAEGHDFYSTPRISPAGDRLAWLTWDHPRMPWDGTDLWVADIDTGRAEPIALATERHVAGGPAESVVQPEWSRRGVLHFVSDRNGWWNLYRADDGAGVTVPVVERAAEFAGPQWVFGLSWYGFDGDRVVAARAEAGRWSLGVIDPDGDETDLGLPYTDIESLVVAGRTAVFAGGSPTEPQCIVRVDLGSGAPTVLRRSQEPDRADLVSVGQPFEFPTGPDGAATAYGLWYRPTNPAYVADLDERPPLLVRGHSGPTSAARTTYDAAVQFWTSRGLGVVDVNYRGSTGYGRDFRHALRGGWGVTDVEDCVAAARFLAERGDVDPARCVMRGSSSSGLTVLRALQTSDRFAAASVSYGVADLELLARDTHKFEARYLDSLIGPYPEARAVYEERSPVHNVAGITAPLIVFHGADDAVVPPTQAHAVVDALTTAGVPVAYVEFADEAHGFRRAETLARVAGAELWFFGRVLGFRPADSLEPVEVRNLS